MNCPQLWPLATGSTLVWGRASTSLVGSSPREGAGPSLRQLHLFLQGVVAEPSLRLLHLFLQGVVAGVVAVPGLRQLPGFPCRR